MKFAVIMPVYNAERFLKRALDCVLPRREVLVFAVDDGSTDFSPSILREYAARFPELHVISLANSGVSAARNAGLSAVLDDPSISHVMFLDADDEFDSSVFERLRSVIPEHPDSIIEFDFLSVDENGRVLRRFTSEGNNIWCRAFPRAVIGDIRFFTRANVAEDIAFNLEIAHRRKAPLVHLDEALYRYTDNPASAMNRRFTAADFSRRSALIDYLIGVYSDSPAALDRFSRTDLPDLLKQFYRQLRRTAPTEAPEARRLFAATLR